MPNPGSRSSIGFVPRTLLAVERGAGALVSRFAAPVRSVGMRALGLVDRLLGVRLLAQTGMAYERAAGDRPGEELVVSVLWCGGPQAAAPAAGGGVGARPERTPLGAPPAIAARPAGRASPAGVPAVEPAAGPRTGTAAPAPTTASGSG